MIANILSKLDVLSCQLHVQAKGIRKYRELDLVSPVSVPAGIGAFTATFLVAFEPDAPTLTLRWEMPDGLTMKKDKFLGLCYAQAEYFNAQLLKLGFGYRVAAFQQTFQVAEDRFDSQRYTIPLSPFEVMAMGGNFGIPPYGAAVEPTE